MRTSLESAERISNVGHVACSVVQPTGIYEGGVLGWVPFFLARRALSAAVPAIQSLSSYESHQYNVTDYTSAMRTAKTEKVYLRRELIQ
jgi:hypothetical protein